MKQLTFAVLIILLLSNCNTPEQQKADNSNRTELIPEPDKDLREAYEKQTAKHQTFNKTISNIPQVLREFIPKGYSVINEAKGDANLDGTTDRILVLKKDDEDTASNYVENKPVKRPLLILLGKADGTYKLALRNDNAVYCIDCGGIGGDPFMTIFIKNNYFSIEHSVAGGEHWERVSTFKYDQKKQTWFLNQERYITYKLNASNDPNAEALIVDTKRTTTAKDFGTVPFSSFDIYKEDRK